MTKSCFYPDALVTRTEDQEIYSTSGEVGVYELLAGLHASNDIVVSPKTKRISFPTVTKV